MFLYVCVCVCVCVCVGEGERERERERSKERSEKRVSDRNIETGRLREKKKKSPVQNSPQLCASPDYNMS